MAHVACLHAQARVGGTDVECGSRLRIRLYRLGLVDPMISEGDKMFRNEPNVEELSSCPHATQGARFRARSRHEAGIGKDPRVDSAMACQGDVAGIPHLSLLYRVWLS